MIIKDELYGTIEFGDLEHRIIDTPDFQRLRRIKQMSFTNLVYPGANHTRFEHSLGTAHLSAFIARKVGLDDDTIEKVKLYALLHDIGHTAFSHEGEDVLSKYLGSHEKISEQKMLKGEIADILNENYKPKEIAGLAKKKEGSIVYSDLGADRMDYLQRDAHNTGVAYGIIDTDRLVHTLSLEGKELVIDEGGLTAAESLLIARFMMFSAVYLHPTVRVATAMLYKAIQHSIEDGTVSAEHFTHLGDEEALALMGNSKDAKQYVDGLTHRKLYKQVCSMPLKNKTEKWAKDLEKELSEKFQTNILVDYPYSFYKKIDMKVSTSNNVVPITKLSELVSALEKNEENRKRILVLCSTDDRKKLEKDLSKFTDKMS